VTDREVLRPGDTVRATVRLTPRKDLVDPTLTANPGRPYLFSIEGK
jgi:hypothetical protein